MKKFILFLFVSLSLGMQAQTSREFVRNKIREWGECKNVAITKHNGDVALYGRNGWAGTGLPRGLSDALDELNDDGEIINDVQLTENGRWLVLYGDNGFLWDGITYSLERKLREFNNNSEVVLSVTFNDAGDWIVITTEHYSASETWIMDWLRGGQDSYGMLWAACITDDGMVACYEEGFKFFGEYPEEMRHALIEADFDVFRIKFAGSAYFFADKYGLYEYNM